MTEATIQALQRAENAYIKALSLLHAKPDSEILKRQTEQRRIRYNALSTIVREELKTDAEQQRLEDLRYLQHLQPQTR